MKIVNDYPKIRTGVKKYLKLRKIILVCFLISIIICSIVNTIVGGKMWMFYVIGAETIIYFMFLNKPLIDNTLVKRFTEVIFLVCAYLYLIDMIEQSSWSYFVINIIAFSTIIVQLLMFLSEIKYQRKKFIPMFWTSIFSIIFCVLAITKVVKINWAIIVLGSLGLFALLILLIFYRKLIIKELQKYFSIK